MMRSTFFIFALLATGFVAYSLLADQSPCPTPEKSTPALRTGVVLEPSEVLAACKKKTIEEYLKAPCCKLFVKFFANWCSPCRRMKPIIATMAKEFAGSVVFIELDLDLYRSVAQSYGVQSIPTFLFIDENGKELTRQTGGTTEAGLRAAIKQHFRL